MTRQDHEALAFLIEEAKKVSMTDAEVAEQRRSFAYGNSAFENPMITKEMIKQEADKLGL
ncbi:MAG: hypothetical protein HOY44_10055 [Maritimibacter sp.]|uniref:hypothetical protein n=1 Tax=Maritimibacter sp. TaxID=2003363 RepID=UPI001D9C595E|nr:hypothetical protein [Maritimibacter sp.]MBL6427856.1 hypothetical protein [Maritimibacter sp.]